MFKSRKIIHWVNSKISLVLWMPLLHYTAFYFSHSTLTLRRQNLCCNIKHICVRAWSIITDMRYILLLFCHCMWYTKIPLRRELAACEGEWVEILEKRNDKNLLNYTPGKAQNYFIHIYYRALMHNFAYIAFAMSDCEIWGKLPVASETKWAVLLLLLMIWKI